MLEQLLAVRKIIMDGADGDFAKLQNALKHYRAGVVAMGFAIANAIGEMFVNFVTRDPQILHPVDKQANTWTEYTIGGSRLLNIQVPDDPLGNDQLGGIWLAQARDKGHTVAPLTTECIERLFKKGTFPLPVLS
jgi:hypothetical protein